MSRHASIRFLSTGALLCALLIAAAPVAAQSVSISSAPSARECGALLEHDGILYGGLRDGGLLLWDAAGDGGYVRRTTEHGLSGNRVTDLYLHGDVLWMATDGAGLTRIDLAGDPPDSRVFTNIGVDLSVAAVAVTEQGGRERAYFGLTNGGVGEISDGLPGIIFTSEATGGGLVNDRIRDLAFDGQDLWIATDEGVSRLRDNAFSDMSAGIGYSNVVCLLNDPGVGLLAGDVNGVWRWDDGAGEWVDFGGLGISVSVLATHQDEVWALAAGTGAADRLFRWTGAVWETLPLPETGALTIAGGSRLWTGGSRRPVAANYKALQAWAAGWDGADWSLREIDELAFSSVDGVSVAPDGSVWAGARNAAGFARHADGAWEQVLETAAAATDSVGLFNIDGGFLDVHATAAGEIWMTQFAAGGVIRYRPDLPDCDHLDSDNSELSGNRIIRIADHPDGPVLLLSDRQGVDVILDPDDWRDPAAWLHLPTDNDGLGSTNVLDALVGASPDRIWFVVKDVGLVLWDVNGNAGGDDPLTWTDAGDDVWAAPLTNVSGSAFDLTGAKAVAVAGDGTVWVGGGGGVLHFRLDDYDAAGLTVTHLQTVREKTTPGGVGLIQGSVLDIELDRNDDLWVAHAGGLDRIALRGGQVRVDAYTGPAQFETFGLIANYAADILAGLPAGMVRELSANADGSLIVGGSEGGLIRVEVGAAGIASAGPLDQLYLYPNPLRPGDHAGLYLGDVDAEVVWGQYALEGGAHVEIYDLEGQLIFRDRHVSADTPFWDGQNLEGGSVASGIYMVRVELDGQVVVKAMTLAR